MSQAEINLLKYIKYNTFDISVPQGHPFVNKFGANSSITAGTTDDGNCNAGFDLILVEN